MTANETSTPLVLYHTLSDSESAEVRRFIVKHGWMGKVRFRNIEESESAQQDLLKLRGAPEVPIMVMGGSLFQGAASIIDALSKNLGDSKT